jgi:hypothetical protein|tara:strand:- start:376 stop:576 length:201 start_codon:yes stop_codon:yes gene_type:complete
MSNHQQRKRRKKMDIQEHMNTLSPEQIEQIEDRFGKDVVGQWNNFIQRRVLCLELYRAELEKAAAQ